MNSILLRIFLMLLGMVMVHPAYAFPDYLSAKDLKAERIAGPFSFPWSVAFLPNGAILVTEKPGRLRLVQPSKPIATISGVPRVQYSNQGGLMDVVLAPDYAQSKVLYLSYSHRHGGDIRIRVLKARYDQAERSLTNARVIFETAPGIARNKHLGGRMVVTPDGYLFLSLGERGEKPRAQDLSDHAGSIVRIHTDGRVPKDNPFIGQADIRPEIWSYGHRNPQGLARDPVTRDIWSDEHGPRGGDELNHIQPGANYGWPLVSYGINYIGTPVGSGKATASGITPPVHYWVPSIATSGLAIIRREDTISFWIVGLVGRTLARVVKTPNGAFEETRFLDDEVGRIRDVRLGPDGYLYILTDASRGYLYRLSPVDG